MSNERQGQARHVKFSWWCCDGYFGTNSLDRLGLSCCSFLTSIASPTFNTAQSRTHSRFHTPPFCIAIIMKLQALALLCATQLTVASTSANKRSFVHKRQNAVPSGAHPSGGVTTTTSTSVTVTTPSVTIVSAATGTAVPPLSSITLGMPTQIPPVVSATFSAGASVPVSGAPSLPTPCKFNYVAGSPSYT